MLSRLRIIEEGMPMLGLEEPEDPLEAIIVGGEEVFFFFQAEDGIRDLIVTGVQTCALPICGGRLLLPPVILQRPLHGAGQVDRRAGSALRGAVGAESGGGQAGGVLRRRSRVRDRKSVV